MDNFTYLSDRRNEIKLRVVMNRMYHQDRQRIFEFRDGFVKAAALFAGSVAFVRIADEAIVKFCLAAITLTSAISLVFGFANKARDSAKRSTEWALLERDIESAGERHFTEENLNQWAARCNELETGEPAPHAGLLERAYQKACKALGSTPKPVTGFERIRLACQSFLPIRIP